MNTESSTYKTINYQIDKLKKQNLIIDDEEFVKQQLQFYGYFNLIKSYREPYIITTSNGISYRSGISFDQILSLYMLDKNLRNAVIASMLDLEEHIKSVAADVISESFGVDPNDYLKFRNFRDKKNRKSQFSLSEILKKINKDLLTDKNPVKHYREVHKNVPPWILFKNIYFSTIVNLVSLFKPREQEKMASYICQPHLVDANLLESRQLMMDTLYICLEYRNLAAHGGRIYNYDCRSKLRPPHSLYVTNAPAHIHGFSQLLLVLSSLNYSNPYETLHEVLNVEVDRHCQLFPEDVTYLAQTLNADIFRA